AGAIRPRCGSNPYHTPSLNCLAQYAEATQNIQQAAQLYLQMAELARQQQSTTESALAYSKAAELLDEMAPNQALMLWKQARQQDPAYRPAISALARHALKTGQYHEAENVLLELIEQTPPSIERARHHLSLAGLYRSRLRELNKARVHIEFAMLYLSEDISFQRELAEFRLATDENFEAIKILDQLIERVLLLKHHGLCRDLLYRTGQILEERLGQPGTALMRYQRALQYTPNHAPAQKRFQMLQSQGVAPEDFSDDQEQAIALQISEKYRILEKKEYQEPSAQSQLLFEIAKLFQQQQEPSQAFEACKRALAFQQYPIEDPRWAFLEKVALHAQKQTELSLFLRAQAQKRATQAIPLLEMALRITPQNQELLAELAIQYERSTQWEKLEQLYARWSEVVPEQTTDHLLKRAQILEQHLHKKIEAEWSLLQVYEQTQQAEHIVPLLEFLYRHQQQDKIETTLERILGPLENPQKADLCVQVASVTLQHQEEEKSLKLFQKALMLQEDHPAALKAVIKLFRKRQEEGPLPPLLFALAKVTEDNQEQKRLHIQRAEILQHTLKQHNEARKAFEDALAAAPKDPIALRKIALFEEQSQHWSAALKHWKRCAELLQNATPKEQQPILEKLCVLYAKIQRTDPLKETLKRYNVVRGRERNLVETAIELAKQHKEARLYLFAAQEVAEQQPEQ
ncbi:MAG: tetratricopeptide repeat protein, partial [Myxococcota bacterium]